MDRYLTDAERLEFELQQEERDERKFLREMYEAPAEPWDECQHERIRWYDYGICPETGYHDCGYICKDCGEQIE
jgi:hypothetical protein